MGLGSVCASYCGGGSERRALEVGVLGWHRGTRVNLLQALEMGVLCRYSGRVDLLRALGWAFCVGIVGVWDCFGL